MRRKDAKSGNQRPTAVEYQPLVLVLIAFSAGIACDRWYPFPFTTWLAAALMLPIAWLVAYFQKRSLFASIVALLAITALGGAWHHDYWHHYRVDDLGFQADEVARPIVVEVTALTSPRWSPAPLKSAMCAIPPQEHSELSVWIERRRDGNQWRSASGNSLLRVRGDLKGVYSGDRLLVYGVLYASSSPLNPGEMDFGEYERTQRRLCRLSCDGPECVEKLETGSGWTWRAWLSRLRDGGNRLLWNHVKAEDAALASALLLGAREQLDQATTEGFFLTGIIHLLAISGIHVGILAFGFWWVARFSPLPRWASLWAAVVLVVIYAVLTDAQAPVVRAAVLVICICAARWFGRVAFAFNTLAAAGMIVLVMNPASLFQVGAQLSFLAVAALACWNPLAAGQESHDPLTQLLERAQPWPIRFLKRMGGGLWRGFLTSALVWAVTTPLVWYRFHLISPVALLLNPIVMLPTTLAMYGGFGVLLLGPFFSPLANLCGWICGTSLGVIQACIDMALQVPANYWFWPQPPLWWVLAFYGTLGVIVAFPAIRPRQKWFPWLWIGAILVGLVSSNADFVPRLHSRSAELQCTFVAVGHGTCVLLELPNGKKFLYDAGRMGMPASGARAISAVLWSRGVTRLDAIVVSHADSDHYNAIPELLRRFSAQRIYVSPVMFHRSTDALEELQRGIAKARVPVSELCSGDKLPLDDDVSLRVIHPSLRGTGGSDNSNSIVLVVEYAGRRIILPGDLESPGLEKVMSQPALDCDIVMVPHHGSKRSDPQGFARWTTPEWVVISGARGKDIDVVRSSYSQAGATVFHTAEDGAVRFTLSRGGIRAFPTRKVGPPQDGHGVGSRVVQK